jgi:hypothetical protein
VVHGVTLNPDHEDSIATVAEVLEALAAAGLVVAARVGVGESLF